jgi:hypothetical protein
MRLRLPFSFLASGCGRTSRSAGSVVLLLGALVVVPWTRAQTVTILNASYFGTGLEVGDTVEVYIEGAAPNAEVTVVANGGSPYSYGYTDGYGNWSNSSELEAGAVRSWTEYWYVNGSAMTPKNYDSVYLRWAPNLPDFSVYANYSGTNCPAQSTAGIQGCGSGTALHWESTPVEYNSTSSIISTGDVDAAVSNWADVQSRLTFVDSDYYISIVIQDGATEDNANGATFTYGLCNSPCYDYIDQCTSACTDAAGVDYAYINLNDTVIETAATYLGATVATLAELTVAHEFGHALRLSHAAATNYICSEVKSVMYPSMSVLYGCGVTAPNTGCDGSVINSTINPSAPPTCLPAGGDWCYEYPEDACT